MLSRLLLAAIAWFTAQAQGGYPALITSYTREIGNIGREVLPLNTLILNLRRGEGSVEHEHILDVICLADDNLGSSDGEDATVALMDWVIAQVDEGILLDEVYYLTGEWAYGFVYMEAPGQDQAPVFAGVVHLTVRGTAL